MIRSDSVLIDLVTSDSSKKLCNLKVNQLQVSWLNDSFRSDSFRNLRLGSDSIRNDLIEVNHLEVIQMIIWIYGILICFKWNVYLQMLFVSLLNMWWWSCKANLVAIGSSS